MNKPGQICQICFTKRPVRFRSNQLSICQACIKEISEAAAVPERIVIAKRFEIELKIHKELDTEARAIHQKRKRIGRPPSDVVFDQQRHEAMVYAFRQVRRREPLLASIYKSLFDDSERCAEANALACDRIAAIDEAHKSAIQLYTNRQREIQASIEALELRRHQVKSEAAAAAERFVSEVISPGPTKSAAAKLIRAASIGLIQWDLSPSSRLVGDKGNELIRRIRARDDNRCVICSRGFERGELHVHHVVPLSNHGTNNDVNLITLCFPCHNKQHDFPVTQVYPTKRRSPSLEFVAVDIETTGFSNSDRIIEIGAARFRNGKIVDSFDSLIRTGRPLPESIVRLTGITDEMLAGAPDAVDVITQLVRFVGRSRLVLHNASFDMRFLSTALVAHGHGVPNRIIDTLPMARKKLPELNNHKLPTLVSFFGLDVTENHRAKADCIATGLLFVALRGVPTPRATSSKRRSGH